MSKWAHSDSHCPRRPIFGKVNGRVYWCKCDRVWRWRYQRGLLETLAQWELIGHARKDTGLEQIAAEIARAEGALSLLEHSPNYDECELQIRRSLIERIKKILEEDE